MIPVFVPRRADGGRRDDIWEHLRTTYWAPLPYRIVEGSGSGEKFSRAMAVNAAAAAVGAWDLAVVADSDSFVDPTQLREAIDLARSTRQLTIAYTQWRSLTEEATVAVLVGGAERSFDRVRDGDRAVSGVIVVPRTVWDAVGGFDEKFIGYGWEDFAFARACTLATGMRRVDGPCWHLNHESVMPDTGDPDYIEGSARFAAYVRAHSLDDLRWIP